MCECNGHTPTCNSKTGECSQCQDFTQGWKCDRCLDGYYGNPLLGSEIGCRPCRCPDTIASGHSYANECLLDPKANDVICLCDQGYAGAKCDVCADNYFGNPDRPGGVCQQCDCSNNVDLNQPGNCDPKSGQCLQCLYDTEGDHCEFCRDGFYGNALEQNCRPCDCNVLGTNQTVQHCDRFTGQCPCLANVRGQYCEDCIENHWKIASGEGCEACNCDPVGSMSEQCNPVSWRGWKDRGEVPELMRIIFGFSTMDNVPVSKDSADANVTSVSLTSGVIQTFTVMVSA